jgi:hypothetical protein
VKVCAGEKNSRGRGGRRRLPPARIHTRPAAIAANGPRAGAAERPRARSALWRPDPRNSAIRINRPASIAPRACGLRVGVPAKWPRAGVPGLRHVRHQPTGAAPTMDAAPPAPRASPSARRRSRRRVTGGGHRNGRRRRGARRHLGEVAACRRSWARRLPPRAHPHPHAGGRGDGPRAAGAGTAAGALRLPRIAIRPPAVAATDRSTAGGGTGRGASGGSKGGCIAAWAGAGAFLTDAGFFAVFAGAAIFTGPSS